MAGGRGRTRVNFFSQRIQISKKIFFWGGGGVGRVDRWAVEQAQTNLPLQFLRSWGHNNALMYKLCP